MGLLDQLDLDRIEPAALWGRLDAATRRAAAEALYRGPRHEAERRQADAVLASRLRFREAAVRRLPVERRVAYLASSVRPDDALASALLLALHLTERRALLAAFLDALGIPHDEGLIRSDHTPAAPDVDRVEAAVAELYTAHPAEQVDLYLASLVAMDPESWGSVAAALRRRVGDTVRADADRR